MHRTACDSLHRPIGIRVRVRVNFHWTGSHLKLIAPLDETARVAVSTTASMTMTAPTSYSSSSSSSSSSNLVPPPLFSFPPFFTLQSHPSTLSTQLTQWSAWVLTWCRYHRVFTLDSETGSALSIPKDASEASREVDTESLWGNPKIERRLPTVSRRQVLAHLVESSKATPDVPLLPAKSTSKNTTTQQTSRVLVYWRRPEEWAEMIYNWVVETGQNRSIMTLFELTEGELIEGQGELAK